MGFSYKIRSKGSFQRPKTFPVLNSITSAQINSVAIPR